MLGADLGKEDARVFVTDPDEPGEGRTFIWTETGWFERLIGDETGAAEFSPLSMDENALHEWLREQDLDITELDDDYAELVLDEWANEDHYYPEAPELSNQEFTPET